MIQHMVVVYDSKCRFCIRCAEWLRREPAYFPVEVIGNRSGLFTERYGQALHVRLNDLVVITDDGSYYTNENAYVMCLYAMRRHRALAFTLSNPLLRPFARWAMRRLSKNRGVLSALTPAPGPRGVQCVEGQCT